MVVLSVILVLLVSANYYSRTQSNDLSAGSIRFDVGDPKPGDEAPDFTLQSVRSNMVTLSDYVGEYVLLYFQEGIMCQACWVQLQHIEDEFTQFEGIGIDRIITITTDPIIPLAQKIDIEGIQTDVLSDPDVSISTIYTTNLYGMMGTNYNGHTFILISPDGDIVFRADYGGAPEYTMYVPIPVLLGDIEANRID